MTKGRRDTPGGPFSCATGGRANPRRPPYDPLRAGSARSRFSPMTERSPIQMTPPIVLDTSFVPADIKAAEWPELEPLYTDLLNRPVGSASDLERWLLDRSELDAAVSEARAELYIATTRFTEDKESNDRWARYLDEIPAKLDPMSFELNKRYVQLASEVGFDGDRWHVLNRNTQREVELFREENIALSTSVTKLNQKYQKLCGQMSVDFQGETFTLPQMARFQEDTDRSVREEAWRATTERRLKDRNAIDEIYDEQIKLRHQMALNAGYENFRDYRHAEFRRFDYTPQDCFDFHEGVEQHVVPLVRELDGERAKALGVDPLRPWDLAVDELGRPPLRPFARGQELIEKSRRVFSRLDPELAGFYDDLGDDLGSTPGLEGSFDLDSRNGKAFGGYQYQRDRTQRPFIFMNAAGLHRDVETMVHEAGHAFHSMLCSGEPLLYYRDYPIEFAEVASMAMELLTMPMWDEYYADESDANRARRAQLEGAAATLAWIATIDAFQHWVYTNPNHTRDERTAKWLEIEYRFGHEVSWEGLEAQRESAWQRQLHLFGHAFYYIEYGIAQLGALGIWLRSLREGVPAALDGYKKGLTLGGSRPLPELFESAGVPFDFGPDQIGTIMNAVSDELAKLPE